MYFRRFYDAQLAQASYLLGCQRTGEAIVVDPNRDVQPYLDAAAAAGLRVTHVTETHIHADFVSGARALAARAGAQLLLSGAGGPDWAYAFAAADSARLLHDGDVVRVGDVQLDVLHTPGHTPEHLSFVVTDAGGGARNAGPWGVLTGDFVFVGDVGRPDLLEKAAGHAGTMEAGARTLFRSLQRFRALPDHVRVWPGHGAGSACGKALGADASSTVGHEKQTNWGLTTDDEAAFVAAVLEGQPEPPPYFARMKQVNQAGPRALGAPPPRLPAPALAAVRRTGAGGGTQVVVDTRPAADYAAGHVPGTLNIPFGSHFATWAGSLLPPDGDVYLLADAADAEAAVRALALVGLDRVDGVFGPDALAVWAAANGALATVAQTTPDDAAALLARGAVAVVDVRGSAEWAAGHLPGALHLPLTAFAARAGELPTDRPVIVHCQGGARSAIAASALAARGHPHAVNMAGGYRAWQQARLPVAAPGADADPVVLSAAR